MQRRDHVGDDAVSVGGVMAMPPIIGPKKSAPPNGSTGATTVRVPRSRRAHRRQLGDLLGQQVVAHRRVRPLVLVAAHRQQDDRVRGVELARLAAGDRAHVNFGRA